MQWWCAARGEAWTWTWQPYPGVWLFVALLAVGWWLAAGGRTASPARRLSTAAGLLLLWAGLDWPLGPLGAGYLASVHVTQFLLIGVTAPALLLLGLPRAAIARGVRARPRLGALLADLTHPVVAFCAFNVSMTVTHWPSVSDAMMGSQLGAFVVDVAWLLAGLWFWWPVIVEVPGRPRFGPMLTVLYLALNGLLVRPPAAIMLFSEHPAYVLYELAPRIGGIDPVDDQQLAGGLMKAGTAWTMALGIAGVVWAWQRRRPRNGPAGHPPGPG